MMTTTDAGNLLKVNRDTVSKWIRAGKLPATRGPSGTLIRVADLEAFLQTYPLGV